MRLYLSSFRMGNQPEALLALLGAGRRTALIMNAADGSLPEQRKIRLAEEMQRLEAIGLEPVEVDLRDYFGHEGDLQAVLGSFDLIWVRGGNCFVLRRAFKQSGADSILAELLGADAVVYGGYSAGIDMLVPSMRGAELVDDPHVVPPGYEAEIVWDGLGLLPYSVAPHYKSDHPESADVDKSVEYMIDHHIPFIALRDGQAIVVDGERQWVVG